MSDRNQYKQIMDVKYDNLELIDVPGIIAENKERWFNQTLTRVNDSAVRLGIVQENITGTNTTRMMNFSSCFRVNFLLIWKEGPLNSCLWPAPLYLRAFCTEQGRLKKQSCWWWKRAALIRWEINCRLLQRGSRMIPEGRHISAAVTFQNELNLLFVFSHTWKHLVNGILFWIIQPIAIFWFFSRSHVCCAWFLFINTFFLHWFKAAIISWVLLQGRCLWNRRR